MRRLRWANICCLVMVTVGFRWDAGLRWEISPDQPILWLELDEKLYATDGFGDKVDQLKGSMESLKNIPSSEQRTEVWRMILGEFDSIETTFLRMRLRPGQIPSIEALHQDTYVEDEALERTIKIEVGVSQGASSGYGSPNVLGSKIVGCKIVITKSTLEDPQFFQHVLIHEIMHCLGIKHQQDDSDSLMSYSNNSPNFSLEERMALTFLYPLDQQAASESATFGLTCSPKQ